MGRRVKRILTAASLLLLVLPAAGYLLVQKTVSFHPQELAALASSAQVLDREGNLLGLRLSAEEQWRLPISLEEMPEPLIQATVAVEDQRFFDHFGVDIWSGIRALTQNLKAHKVLSGASTLTMQLCRMLENRPRTFRSKCIEAARALALEDSLDKKTILQAYLNLAPYGGNLQGVEAAAMRYFGVHARDLSLGEAALLAGLPKSPENYRLDRGLDRALARRETVFRRMVEEGFLSPAEAERAAAEPVRLKIGPIGAPEQDAFHAVQWALDLRPQGGRLALDLNLQREVERLAGEHALCLPPKSQAAAVVIRIESGDLSALIGSLDPEDPEGGQVNGALARRSPGSALKPFIYAAAFEAGRLSPESTVFDLPIERAGWSPGNFDGSFQGELSAGEALRRSLNIPAILVAEGIGMARCLGLLEAVSLNLGAQAQTRGGLAVVTGAVEVRLFDLVNAYAVLGRQGIFRSARLFLDESRSSRPVLNPEVCAVIDDQLSSRRRTPRGMEDRPREEVPWFMWKTGTSSGRRDAWAVGHNGRYAVGVWVGRFSGAGHNAFVGSEAAEPLLARIFDLPGIRRMQDPPAPKPLRVRSPLPPPPEARKEEFCLDAPREGALFIAVGKEARVPVRARGAEGCWWFLDGRFIEDPLPEESLGVGPGLHEFRCVNPEGRAASVRFSVR